MSLFDPLGMVHRKPTGRKPATRRNGEPRDSQRSKLYSAELAVRGRDTGPGALPPDASVEDVQRYVDAITASAWWRDYVGARRRSVTVLDGRGRRRAGSLSHTNKITMPKWSRTRFVVLHELAHQVTDVRYGSDAVAAHGPEYAGVLLSLVSRFLGVVKASELLAQYRCRGVKVTPPRKG